MKNLVKLYNVWLNKRKVLCITLTKSFKNVLTEFEWQWSNCTLWFDRSHKTSLLEQIRLHFPCVFFHLLCGKRGKKSSKKINLICIFIIFAKIKACFICKKNIWHIYIDACRVKSGFKTVPPQLYFEIAAHFLC